MRSSTRYLISPWQKLIADPVGFPDHPSQDTCWTWIGAVQPGGTGMARRIRGSEQPITMELITRPDRPVAKFQGKRVTPGRVLWAYAHNCELEEVPARLPRLCRNGLCVNPLHTINHVPSPAQAPPQVPTAPTDQEYIARLSLFNAFFEANTTDINNPRLKDMIADPQDITTYFPQYLQFIAGKSEDEIIHALEEGLV